MLKQTFTFILFLKVLFIHSFICSLQFNLLTTFYNEKNIQRKLEYKRCFLENINNKFINKVYVFYENPQGIEDYLKNSKVKVIPINKRPSFQTYFDFANKYLRDKFIIISNTDIFFDQTLGLLKNFSFRNQVLALTRYNIPEYNGKWIRHTLSFDSWIFKAPLTVKTNSIIGTFGSDLLIAYDLLALNIKVINPSLSIKTWHVHLSDDRKYEKKGEAVSKHWQKIIKTIRELIPFTYI